LSVAGPETNGLILNFSRRLVHDVQAHTHNPTSCKKIKHQHHGPHKLPAPSSSNFRGKCNPRTSHDGARSLKHGNVLFIDCTNSSVILLTILLITLDQHARGHKVSFGCDDSCFFRGCCIKTTRTDPCYSVISFLPMSPKSSSCFGMILDEGGGGAIVTMLSYNRGRLHIFFVQRNNNSKYLRKKHLRKKYNTL
jgi:hypothetical protein